MKSILLIAVLFTVLNFGTALYFHIAETERKCFIEEVPDETLVVGESFGTQIVNAQYFTSLFHCRQL